MSNPWAESDWQDLLGEEPVVDQEFKKTSVVMIINDKQTLNFVLEFLLNNVNTATGKYSILYFNSILLELSQLDVVKIQDLMKDVDNHSEPEANWFGESIYMASNIMKKEKTLKKILVISKVDPFKSDTEVTQVVIKSNDLADSKVQLQVLALSNQLDFKKFRKLNSKVIAEDQIWDMVSYDQLKDTLMEMRDGRAIALDLLFYLSDKVSISVKGYKNVVERKVPASQKIDPRSRRPVKNKVTYVDSLTAKELATNDIAYYYSFGGEKCVFTREEIEYVKDWGVPSICLIGFRPLGALKDKFNIDTSYFVVPNEAKTQGSTILMAHLISRMHEKQVIGICTMVAKKGAAIRLVALIPSFEDGDRFNMIPLPFADEMRPVPSSIVDLRNLNIN